MIRRSMLAATLALVVGCGSNGPAEAESFGSTAQSLTVIPSNGFIPLPVLADDTHRPVEDAGGNRVSGWDGSGAELIAADALAQCMLTSSFFATTLAPHARGLDEFLFSLWGRMQQNVCYLPGESLYPVDTDGGDPVERYLIGRMTPQCNIDPTTGDAAAIPLPERDVSAYTSFTDDFRDSWTEILSTTLVDLANVYPKISQPVSYAELNLCMAQRMQEQLNSATNLFASDGEQLELLGYVRERAQLAVIQYSLLGKVLAAPGTLPSSVGNPNQLLAIFRAWGEQPSSKEALAVLGADFATAVRIDLEATNEFASLLRRQASARANLLESGGRAKADWGNFSPRARLLSMLYGGDPLTTSDAPSPGRGIGGTPVRDLPFVEADMKSPELGSLLGLARKAGVLNFKLLRSSADSTQSVGIDIEATAKRLYDEVERSLRQRRCVIEGADPCPGAVTLPTSPDDYLLWVEHRVRASHARELTRAFAEALGPSATGSIDNPSVSEGYGFGSSMFQFIGEHQALVIDGQPWIHLDSSFDIRALSPQQLAIRFDPGRFLPAEIDLGANQYQQGFVSNRDTLFEAPDDVSQEPGGSWRELRALGTVPVLAFAREALLQGRQAVPAVQDFFSTSAASSVLPLIERAIGSSTVAIRPELQAVDQTGTACSGSSYLGPSPCRVLEQRRNGNKVFYNVDYLTTTTDFFSQLAVGNYQRDLETAALDDRFESFRGVNRADVDALPKLSPTTATYGSGTSARERRRFSVSRQLAPGTPGVSCDYIEQLGNGNLKFSVTFPQVQYYVEVFAKRDGIQDVAQNIVGSQVANADGTFTYSLVRSASQYAAGNQVEVRFYSYRFGEPGVFTPGPTSSAWSGVFGYGTDGCEPGASAGPSSEQTIVMLYGEEDDTSAYLPLNELPRRELGGYFLGLGSSLNDLAREAWRFQSSDWSSPVLDAFDLPLDWVPPADASLVGGQAGEESYQYYLRSARVAAEEATAAVKTAIDTVSAEAVDATALSNADARAEKIGEIEQKALCGAAESCDLTSQLWMPALDNRCPSLPVGEGRNFCETLTSRLFDLIGPINLPDVVISETFRDTPDFSRFSGGELQRILTAQWTAAKNLNLVVRNQVEAAVALGRDIDASAAALTSAFTDKEAKVSAAQVQVDAIGQQAQNHRNDIAAMKAQEQSLQGQTDHQCCTGLTVNTTCTQKKIRVPCTLCAAPDTVEISVCTYCGPEAPPACGLVESLCAGYGYSGQNVGVRGGVGNGGHDLTISGIQGKSWSPGPLIAAEQQCRTMQAQLALLRETNLPKIDALNEQIETLEGEIGPTALKTALAEERAAWAAYTAAHALAAGAHDKATAQFGAQLTLVQQALGEVVAASTELSAAEGRKDAAIARGELDSDLRARELETRFGLRRKFQSYDLWRARALLESARRMAVAARRAIEARFVVDLSALDSPQVFVEAPSLWVDEIYSTDLNAPAAVGLSRSPTIDGSVFPNKLLDYVGNLERFVQGYTVAYPTSVANPDSEVFSIPGPDMRVVREVNDASVEYVDARSGGWQFSCSKTEPTWFGHPGAAEYPLVTQLAVACDGAPPVRARYSFNLDPWARFLGDSATPGFMERHNVRWRRLAVNLVGTGVRDCRRAADPGACYSDSFVRYDLKHAGPAWVTNHSRQWRAFNIPKGQIEGAKGLATEEWLDPIANSWNQPVVTNVSRTELFGRPVDGAYEILLELTPDIRLERIERIQVLTETDYWVRQD